MEKKSVILLGATGLVGSCLFDLLKNDEAFSEIKILVRRPLETKHPKVKIVVIDFSNEEDFNSEMKDADVVFCAIGTTNKKMKGNQTEYRKVDFDIAVNAARYSFESSCRQFVLISSVGANSKSNNFYLKLKGEVEEAILAIGFSKVSIFRPSMLMGKRKEFRLGEKIGKIFMVPISFLFPKKMRPIKACDVAKSMLKASNLDTMGVKIYEYKEMKELINGK